MQTISQILAQELNCKQEYIENVIALLDEGSTIPFIARYRKEQHGAQRRSTQLCNAQHSSAQHRSQGEYPARGESSAA